MQSNCITHFSSVMVICSYVNTLGIKIKWRRIEQIPGAGNFLTFFFFSNQIHPHLPSHSYSNVVMWLYDVQRIKSANQNENSLANMSYFGNRRHVWGNCTRLNLAHSLYKILKVERHNDRFYVFAVALLGNCRDAFVWEWVRRTQHFFCDISKWLLFGSGLDENKKVSPLCLHEQPSALQCACHAGSLHCNDIPWEQSGT